MCSRIGDAFTFCLQLEEDDDGCLSLSEHDIDSEIFNPENIVGTKMYGENYSSTKAADNLRNSQKLIDEAVIDQVVASMDDIAKMKMVQELSKIRRRVSIVPDTNTIVEDQFLEPMAAETGIECDKGADMLTRNDRKRMVRRISLRIASDIGDELERKKSEDTSTTENLNNRLSLDVRTSVSKKIHNSRKLKKNKTYEKSSNQSNNGSDDQMLESIPSENIIENQDFTTAIKKSFTNFISKFLTDDSDFACNSGISISQRSSNSFISDELSYQARPSVQHTVILKADQRYDKRLERYRRNTLNSLHRGSLGAAEQSQGLIQGPKRTSSSLSFNKLNHSESALSKKTSQQQLILQKKSEITMNRKESYTRNMSISARDISARPKLVNNDENVSSYPLPGTDYSTKMGGTWRTTQNAKNLLSEKEITDILNKTILDEVKSKNKENK